MDEWYRYGVNTPKLPKKWLPRLTRLLRKDYTIRKEVNAKSYEVRYVLCPNFPDKAILSDQFGGESLVVSKNLDGLLPYYKLICEGDNES